MPFAPGQGDSRLRGRRRLGLARRLLGPNITFEEFSVTVREPIEEPQPNGGRVTTGPEPEPELEPEPAPKPEPWLLLLSLVPRPWLVPRVPFLPPRGSKALNSWWKAAAASCPVSALSLTFRSIWAAESS